MTGTGVDAVSVYVKLIGQSVDVWRPVHAEHISGSVYRIVPQEYDRSIETWEFEPGDEVVCRMVSRKEGPTLTATARFSP
jgi:hypothetical protein